MKTFYLVDGHAHLFRAYYAPFGGPLTAPNGEPTKATFVFTQMILNILRDQKPDYFAIALDYGDEATERKEYFPEYKANRESAPEDFGVQVRRIEEILETMGVPTFTVRGHEADDIIATIAERLADEDIELRIVAKDKDLYQVLSDKVSLWDPSLGVTMTPEMLREKYGYGPDQAIEIQTLTGDSTDNVPGVPGIGPKKAQALISKYGSVSGVVEHADELTPKMKENVKKHGDAFQLTRRLVTLKRDVPFEFDLESCRKDAIAAEKALPIFRELELRRLIDLVHKNVGAGALAGTPLGTMIETADTSSGEKLTRAVSGQYTLVNTESALAEFLDELGKQKRFAIDTETTSLHAIDCDLVGISISWKAETGSYIALRSSTGPALDPEKALAALRPILENPEIKKVGHNIKFDLVVLRSAGIRLAGVDFDSMVASYVLLPDRRGHGMDALARDLLGHETIPITSLIGEAKNPKKQKSMLDVDLEPLADYAAEDADITWRLFETLAPKVAESTVESLFDDVEMPLVEVLAEMEFNGVSLDCERLGQIEAKLNKRIAELESEIHKAAGHEFNIDSPKQLGTVLFDEIGLKVVKRTKTGRSTDARVLETLALSSEHPLPGLVLEYRELTKLLGTYVEPLPALISSRTNRLHAGFHQTVTATGRLSSSDPNLQNIPIRTEQGREIRAAFVASASERVIIAADYSQIELRILAHLSRDDALIEAFRSDEDIHAFVAAQIAGVTPEEVTREQRSKAKAVNFGIIYGQGEFGLSRSLGISRGEARAFIADYKARYPGIVRFMDDCIGRAEREGGVKTMLGRYRAIPEVRSANRMTRGQGERLAINTVVQGSAADMIKVAMVRIGARTREERLDLQLLIQVHDELVLECPRDRVEDYAEIVRREMADALPLDVPVKVDVGWGASWLEGK